jgi:hypothetical protein
MYRSGRQIAGLGEPETQKGEKNGIPVAAGSLEGAAGKRITEPTVKTAFIPAALVPALAPTLAPAAIPTAVAPTAVPAVAGGSLATVAIPVAMGIYVAVAIYSLISYSAFQNELAAQGYIILPSPLQVCIGNCHQPKAQQPSPWLLGPVNPPFGQPFNPLPQSFPQPWPETLPQSWPREEDKRKNKCKTNWVAPQFGRYPCHSDFAKLFNGTRLEYQVTTPYGLTADFDSVRGDVLIEVKTGYQWLLNKNLSSEMQARRILVIERFMEQSIRQRQIAESCNYKLEWYFNSKAVAEAMQLILPHIEVKWRPYDCKKDSDHTW